MVFFKWVAKFVSKNVLKKSGKIIISAACTVATIVVADVIDHVFKKEDTLDKH